MRVWLYARLSSDTGLELNSLTNQLEICRSFAQQRDFHIVGHSSDDNISGMTLQRPGIDALTQAAERGKIDGVIVKDLSRLGRHCTQTALYIDFLREHDVRVISVTEGLDTMKEDDELIIGVRSMMNDIYARDIGNKIRAGYHQKLQAGLVITPPFGYRKDRNTNQILIQEEAASTVQLIFSLYVHGLGQKVIAQRLNDLKCKTPAQLREIQCGKSIYTTQKSHSGQYLWTYPSVKNVLTEEAYTGILINHYTETNNGNITRLPPSKRFRHENALPPIISKELWNAAQKRLKAEARPAHGNKLKHRYAGLLRCAECGNVFVPMIQYWNGNRRVEYICRGYQCSGKGFCSSHRIHEEVLDQQVQAYAEQLRSRWRAEQKRLAALQKMWALKQPRLNAHIQGLEDKIQRLDGDVDQIMMKKLFGRQ